MHHCKERPPIVLGRTPGVGSPSLPGASRVHIPFRGFILAKGFAITFCDHIVGISRCNIEELHSDPTEWPANSCVLIHLGR